MRIAGKIFVLLLAAGVCRADSLSPATVEVHLNGRTLDNTAATTGIADLAVRLVVSSQFSTDERVRHLSLAPPEVFREYRRSTAGDHVVVTYETSVPLSSSENRVNVREIVVGLDETGAANRLYTVDDSGALAMHGKFSGLFALRMRDAVRGIATGRGRGFISTASDRIDVVPQVGTSTVQTTGLPP